MHQPTERVLKIIEHVCLEKGGKRLADLSGTLGMPKSTLLPILNTLCEKHYLARDGERYFPGAALFSLSRFFGDEPPVMEYVHRELVLLVKQLGETCYFGTLEGGNVVYLDKVDSPNPLRMLTTIGKRLPAYATGIGKALLLCKSEAELRALYPDGLTPLTAKTVTDLAALKKQLSECEREGYAFEIEESTEFIRCFAVPVKRFGETVAAVSAAIPTFRFDEAKRGEVISALCDVAERISWLLEAVEGGLDGFFTLSQRKG